MAVRNHGAVGSTGAATATPTAAGLQTRAGGVHVVDEGDGPPLVLIHGWCGDGSHFAPQLEHFRATHRVVVPDLPWHGASAQSGPISVAAFGTAVAAVLDELDTGPAVIVGHSLGGFVAVQLASERPDLVSGVVVLDSGFGIRPEFMAMLGDFLHTLEGDGRRDALRGLCDHALYVPTDDAALRERITTQMLDADARLHVEGERTMIAFMQGEGDDRLAALTVPVAMVSSSEAGSDPERLRALQPDAGYAQVLWAGHYLQLFAAEQVNAIVDQFVRVVAADALAA